MIWALLAPLISPQRNAGLKQPVKEARWLLAAHLACDISALWQITPTDPLPQSTLFLERLAERTKHKPLSRIMKYRAFWRSEFLITDDVLDPRPDSEWLLEAAQCLISEPPQTILDLGTGSGALLLSALQIWPEATGLGIDCSAKALAVAKENARRLDLVSRVDFKQQHWLSEKLTPVDLILCNPPYIPRNTPIPEAVRYDPALALFADEQGLSDWRKILSTLSCAMHHHTLCVGECSPSQTSDLASIAYHHNFRAYSALCPNITPLIPTQQVGVIILQNFV